MKDMLVRLNELPNIDILTNELAQKGMIIRRPIAPEKSLLTDWVEKNFSAYWASEMDVAFVEKPVNCFIAQKDGNPIGFACYDTTTKNFFGPTGVLEESRGLGIGKVLLVKSLLALKERGYAYAIIGGVGPIEYYQKAVNAVLIEGSENSIYNDLLKNQ